MREPSQAGPFHWYRPHRLRRGWARAQRTVRTHGRVLLPSPFEQESGFGQRVARRPRQQFIPELAVERLHVAVLPGVAPLDERRLYRHGPQPRSHDVRRTLRAVVPSLTETGFATTHLETSVPVMAVASSTTGATWVAMDVAKVTPTGTDQDAGRSPPSDACRQHRSRGRAVCHLVGTRAALCRRVRADP